ncbi:MAG: hypothetical protein MUC38_08590 [Cyclobacteriaceae bacterium]|jgi:hypothetical protein|nr:hypothetical protein [Cyclobacteriaceae bacterium]
MKRLLALFLMLVVLLNSAGYYGVLVLFRYQTKASLSKQLDNNERDRSREVVFEVSISLPYAPDQTEFVRVDGEFTHEGQIYHIVEQKYARDRLYIVCVKDNKSADLEVALADYVKSFTDQRSDAQKQSKSTFNFSFVKEYVSLGHFLSRPVTGWTWQLLRADESAEAVLDRLKRVATPPPRS